MEEEWKRMEEEWKRTHVDSMTHDLQGFQELL